MLITPERQCRNRSQDNYYVAVCVVFVVSVRVPKSLVHPNIASVTGTPRPNIASLMGTLGPLNASDMGTGGPKIRGPISRVHRTYKPLPI